MEWEVSNTPADDDNPENVSLHMTEEEAKTLTDFLLASIHEFGKPTNISLRELDVISGLIEKRRVAMRDSSTVD